MDVAGPAGHVILGLALGASLAAPPGPVNALIAREAARHGPAAGIRAGLPAPIVDTCYMLLVFAGVSRFDIRPAAPYLAAAGALLMTYLALATVRHREGSRELAGPWAVWAVTLTNPFQYAWWLSAGAAFLAAQGPWGVVGFMAAIFGWVLAFSVLVARGAQKWPWFVPLLEVVSADLLLAFALKLALGAAAGL